MPVAVEQDADRIVFGPAAADALTRHPHFEQAMLAAAEIIVDSYGGNAVMNRIMNDRGRVIAAMMVVDLHFTADGSACTVARLRDEAQRYGFASPRRMSAWVASLRLLGFLKAVAGKRPQRLVPTPPFLALHARRMRRQWEVLFPLHPGSAQAAALLDDPAALGACAHAFIGAYRRGMRLLTLTPELAVIAERDAGLTVLMSLLLAAARGKPASIAVLARRFMVSRSHVMTIFRDAEAEGLLTHSGGYAGHTIGPAFQTVIRRFFAGLFLAHMHGIDTVLQHHAAQRTDRCPQDGCLGRSPATS
jgi:hypothetical protein